MDNISRNNKVEFKLVSDKQPSLVLNTDPPNWDNDEKTYQLDKNSRGVLRKINTELEITKEGFDYLYGSTLVNGLNPEIKIIKSGKDELDINETWRTLYEAGLDMENAEFELDRRVAKVQFTQGGLYDKIKAKISTKFDLVSRVDANGNEITELTTITVQELGRDILRISKGSVENGIRVQHVVGGGFLGGGDRDVARAAVFQITDNSDREYINSVNVGQEAMGFNNGDYANGQVGGLLFTRSDRTRTRTIKGLLKVRMYDGDSGYLDLDRVYYRYNTATSTYEYERKENIVRLLNPSVNDIIQHDFNNETITLEAEQAMSYIFHSNTNDGVGYEYIDNTIEIKENASYPSTIAKNLLPFELIDRFLEKITGEKGLLKSNVLGRKDLGYEEDGEWAYLATATGFWARGFDLTPSEDPKQFQTSLKDALDSLYVQFPWMYCIEKVNGKEYFRFEKLDYTQQYFTSIELGKNTLSGFTKIKASKPVITILADNLYTGAIFGYKSGGKDYEEVFGLASPHGIAEYSTSYKGSKENIYNQVSTYRADLEGYELARIKQKEFFPDEDTNYDQSIFFRHLKKVGGQYFMRTWQDDLDSEPNGEGVYSPETMGNLLLTPFRCLLRHRKILATSIYKDPYETLNFTSSNCFSAFSTTIDGVEIFENGNIINLDMGKPYISEYLLSFEGKVYQEMIDQIEGFTMIDGEEVPNVFGIYEVLIGDTLYKGKLFKVQISGTGKHEIALLP